MKDVETIKRDFDNSGGISRAIYGIDDKGQADRGVGCGYGWCSLDLE